MRILVVLGVAALPIGGVSEGIASGMDLRLYVWVSYAAAVLGGITPVPFLMIVLKELADGFKTLGGGGNREKRKHAEAAYGMGSALYALGAPAAFICASLPFITCASWIGAAVAVASGMSAWKSFVVVTLGTLVSGLLFLVMSETRIFI